MLNSKKAGIFALAIAALGLAACGNNGGSSESKSSVSSETTVSTEVSSEAGKVDLNVWCPSGDNDVMNNIITAFKAAHPEAGTVQILANVPEGEIKSNLTKDVTAAADVFCIADDNIRECVAAYALEPLTEAEKAAEVALNGQAAVDAGSINGTDYGYAYRGDNSYPFYYDGGFFTEADVGSLETVLAKAQAAEKKVYIPFNDAWYAPSFMWANGGTLNISADGTKTESNFNNENGVAAAEAMMDLYQTYGGTTMIWSSSNAEIEAGFADGSVVACMLWNDYGTIKAGMGTRGDDLKVTKLPTFNINGVDKQLGAFVGYKHMSVKAGLDASKKALAKAFCVFATNEENQKTRASQLGYGPSALSLAEAPEVKALPFVAGIAAQSAAGGAYAQASSVTGAFWTPMADFTSIIQNSTDGSWGDYESAQDALDAFVEAIAQ